MVDVLEVVSSEAAKVAAAALVGRVDKAVSRVVDLVRGKLGGAPPDTGRILAAVRDDPEFADDLARLLTTVHDGAEQVHGPVGITGYRNHVRYLADPPTSGLRVIAGPPGSGRTELARQLADRARDRIPVRPIEIDLAGLRVDGVVDMAVVKQRVLRELGVPDAELVVDNVGLDQQFGSALSTRLCTIILDNVVLASELQPFLPFRLNLLLVTTSVMTRELAALDRAPILLRGLDEDGALELLADFSSPVRPADEPVEARRLVELCGHMPAAVQQAGLTLARRAGEPQPVAGLLAHYRTTGVVDAEGAIRDALQRTFAELSAEAVLGAAQLATFPGGWFTRATAAAYLGGHNGERVFEEVVDAQLTEPARGGWHRLTTLAGQYAATLAADREAAFDRLLRYVRDHVVAADLAGDQPGKPGRLREYVVPAGVAWTLPEDRFDWLDRHLGLIGELVRAAYWRRRHKEVCQLAGAVEVLVNQRGRWREFADISDTAVRAAEALDSERAAEGKGAPALVARALSMRARARFLARWFPPAAEDLERAWRLAGSAEIPDWRRRRLLSSVAEFRGRCCEEQADDVVAVTAPSEAQRQERARLLAEAERWLSTAVAVDGEIDHGYALGIHLRMRASILVKAGRAEEALTAANQAAEHVTGRNAARLDMVAAKAYLAIGAPQRARECWERAARLLQQTRADQYEWELREIGARILTAEGRIEEAWFAWQELLGKAFTYGHPRTNEYLSELGSLPSPSGRPR
ncbi:hypothetical protein [Amycolatopsis sp. SID8362]|uniref:hypothetical protein n=1 Tax=Amycolatopsis sp. SID8362 TaxID=2690346 RepID=UPI00136B2965|nr:hypothetical protein [Amycolatopsis sp. SID8362]NBH12128.1 hypothetical protein [Amycolatopsis sp. SID8362]NED48820.1 hypothetical protein [Amycolatopsis sp. SID8362]